MRLPNGSGMSREAPVPFYEGLTGKFRGSTHQTLIHEGGFALITGEPGSGKSITLRVLAERLSLRRDAHVGALTHTNATLTDFYRELADMFSVALSFNNRWAGFKQLRERWVTHMESTLFRPILLIDEAQEMHNSVLNELRLLTSLKFDSQVLLTIILAGDGRLTEKLKHDELIPLGSRIRTRLTLEHASCEQLLTGLKHLLSEAGNPALMTPELMNTLAEHAMGNYRALCVMSNEMLTYAFKHELPQLDEKLFFEIFSLPTTSKSKGRN